MKHFFLFTFLLLTCPYIKGEAPFKLTVKIDGLPTDTIIFKYFRCEKDSWVIDTISVATGTFTIEDSISPRTNAYFSYLSEKDKEVLMLLDPGEMQLYLKKDSLENFVLTGSQSQTDREILLAQTKPLEDELLKLSSEQREQNNDFLKSQKDSIQSLLENNWIDYITSHPASHYSLDLIFRLLSNKKQNRDVLMSLYDGLSENVKVSCSGEQIHNFILHKVKPTMTNVSSLEAFDKDGNLVRLSDYKRKYILVDFWATWCVYCIKGFPHLKELYAKYKDKGLVVISVSIDRKEDEQKWLNAIEKYNLSEWIHILSCNNMGENSIGNLHEAIGSGVPHYIVIDTSGNVIKQWIGFDNEVAKEQNELFENIFK